MTILFRFTMRSESKNAGETTQLMRTAKEEINKKSFNDMHNTYFQQELHQQAISINL